MPRSKDAAKTRRRSSSSALMGRRTSVPKRKRRRAPSDRSESRDSRFCSDEENNSCTNKKGLFTFFYEEIFGNRLVICLCPIETSSSCELVGEHRKNKDF